MDFEQQTLIAVAFVPHFCQLLPDFSFVSLRSFRFANRFDKVLPKSDKYAAAVGAAVATAVISHEIGQAERTFVWDAVHKR